MRYMVLGITAVMAANVAQAATVGIEAGKTLGARPTDGLFSTYNGYLNAIKTETFNTPGQQQTCAFQNRGIGIANLGSGDAALVSGRFIGRALPPGTNSASIAAGRVDTDTGCYLSTPNPTGNQTATINPVKLAINLGQTTPTLYLGFYWGSIDSYNSISFFDKQGNTINFGNVPTSFGTGLVTGQDVINLFGLGSAESRFIDFTFTAADNFGYALLSSGHTAFELDNIAFGAVNPVGAQAGIAQSSLLVPEPAIAGLLGLGTIGALATRSRRRFRG